MYVCLKAYVYIVMFTFAGLENISHMPPATGPDKQPSNVVRVSNALKHK
jgi:hypothetical protein